jgi:hypothetical protein
MTFLKNTTLGMSLFGITPVEKCTFYERQLYIFELLIPAQWHMVLKPDKAAG